MPEKPEIPSGSNNFPVFQYSWMKKTFVDPEFSKETMLIRKGVTVSMLKTLIITSTNVYPSPAFIIKALAMGSKDVELQHSWTNTENFKPWWSGTIAIYKKLRHLKRAADHIIRYFDDIQVIWFPDIVHLLVIAERSHKLFDVGVSKVIVKGIRSFKKEEQFMFKKTLSAFGELKKITFVKGTTEFGKIAVAEYRFVTHAFVAKFHLNGLQYGDIGFLHAEVVMKEKEKSVQKEVVRRFTEHFNSSS